MNRFGIMLDMSRNAVMNIDSLKRFIDYIKKLGYNCLMLYTEDTFEVNNEEYFGSRRGRYSKTELKLIDSYCTENGIELIPCIQTLAHLNCIFKWEEYSSIHDIDDILLTNDDRTYKLIDNIFSTIKECFKSKLVHIGMDEAWHLGLGKYLEKNGYEKRFDIISKHLDKVVEIAKKYDFSCIMWSDMFIRQATNGDYYDTNSFKLTENLKSSINKDVQLVYWDYYHKEQKHYNDMIIEHKQISKNDVWFAGGAWSWVGFTPHNKYTLKTMLPAMRACKENNISNIIITMWGDNGAECSKFALLPSLYRIKCEYDGIIDEKIIKSNFQSLTGENYDSLTCLDLPDCLSQKEDYISNPSKYVLYSDLFNGFLEDGFFDGREKFYFEYAKKLKSIESNNFKYLFNSSYKLCLALSSKYSLGKNLRTSYFNNDKITLKKIIKKITITEKQIKDFYNTFQKQWFLENKPNGFDVQDIRFGALIFRLESCKKRLKDYVNGKIKTIPELDEKLLPVFTKKGNVKEIEFENIWSNIVTLNNL